MTMGGHISVMISYYKGACETLSEVVQKIERYGTGSTQRISIVDRSSE